MAEAYANINPTIVTFAGWLEKTNRLLSALSSIIVTTSANSSGGTTTGNAYVNGILAANTIAATQGLRGGTVGASANLVMTSNLDVSGQTLLTGNNVIFGTAGQLVSNGNWGFGTSTPAYPVDVFGSANTVFRVRGYEPSVMLTSNNRSWSVSVAGLTGRFYVYDLASGAERLSISNTGLVGIGNTNPLHGLSVNGNSYFSDSMYFKSTAGLNANGSFGTSGYVLASNGSGLYWAAPASVTFGGANTNVLFNDSTGANGSSSFTYDKATQNLYVANTIQGNTLSVNAVSVGGVNTINSTAFTLNGRLVANGSNGAAGWVLTSSNTGNAYWSLFTGGLIAGNGLGSNSTHYFVNPGSGSGLIANSSGLFVSGPQSIPTLATGNTTVTGFLSVSNNVTVGNTSVYGGVVSVGNSTSNSSLAEFGSRLQVPIIRGGREEVSANTTASGAMTLDLNYGVFRWTVTGNVSSISFSNAPANNIVYSGTLHVTRDASTNSTNRTITFPASTKWAGALAPPPTSNANAIDVYQFWTIDGGSTYIWSMAIKDAR